MRAFLDKAAKPRKNHRSAAAKVASAKTAATKVAEAKAATVKAATPERDPLADLALNATSVTTGRGVAVINGHAYVTGERIDDVPSSDPCTLAEVTTRKAVLLFRGKRVDLEFSELSGSGTAVPRSTPRESTLIAVAVAARAAGAGERSP